MLGQTTFHCTEAVLPPRTLPKRDQSMSRRCNHGHQNLASLAALFRARNRRAAFELPNRKLLGPDACRGFRSHNKLPNTKNQVNREQTKYRCVWPKAADRKFSPQRSSSPAANISRTNFSSGFRRPRSHARNISWLLVVRHLVETCLDIWWCCGLRVFPSEPSLLTVSKTLKAEGRLDFSTDFRFFLNSVIFSSFANMIDLIPVLSDEKQAQ